MSIAMYGKKDCVEVKLKRAFAQINPLMILAWLLLVWSLILVWLLLLV